MFLFHLAMIIRLGEVLLVNLTLKKKVYIIEIFLVYTLIISFTEAMRYIRIFSLSLIN